MWALALDTAKALRSPSGYFGLRPPLGTSLQPIASACCLLLGLGSLHIAAAPLVNEMMEANLSHTPESPRTRIASCVSVVVSPMFILPR